METATASPERRETIIGPSGDMSVEHLRAALHEASDLVADYLADIEGRAVMPRLRLGELTDDLDGGPPEEPVPFETIMDDARRLVVPNVTHWQHPAFMAYFPTTASGPGIVGELLMSALVSNAMLWRTSPVASELEAITVRWLRHGLGLPADFDGLYADTASTNSLTALAAARQLTTGDATQVGLGRSPRLRVYASAEAHSSIEKACMTLGIGRDGLRRIPVDDSYAMEPRALAEAIESDRAAGWRPCAVVATIGTTSSTAVDPVADIADLAEREGLWLHVDAAYAGAAALIHERRPLFAGWERAQSIVVNPHKWLFTPLDCSLLLTRRMDALQAAFGLRPEYLREIGGADRARDYHELIPQLGRRPRAIKMWILLRAFGLSGLRDRIARHIELAQELAGWVDEEPDAQRLAPVPFSTVCLRWRPSRLAGREREPGVASDLDELNERILEAVNASGHAFLSHTRLRDGFTIRVSIGNIRTEQRHVIEVWRLIREHGRRLSSAIGSWAS